MKIVVRGAWSASDALRYRALRADHVELSHAKGFDSDSSLDFLAELDGLRRLTVLVPGTVDLAPIAHCHDLEELNLDIAEARRPVELAGLTRLRDLGVEPARVVSDLYELVGVTSLLIGRYPETSLQALAKLTNLTWLRLYEARRLLSLDGMEHLTRLTKFDLAAGRSLTDVSALATATTLTSLEVTGATAVGDWSVVGQLANLRWLSFEDVRMIDSVDFVLRLGALRKFYATGNTKVADGRVAQLGSHPTLRTFRLAQSRRHDATSAEIRKQLGGFRLF